MARAEVYRIDEIEVSKRCGHIGAGARTYDQRMAEAGKSDSRTDRHCAQRCWTARAIPKLYQDLICRLRLAKDVESPFSVAAAAHGALRRAQGYSPSNLIQESRVFQVATFDTLKLHQGELDSNQVLSDAMVIADEVDAQLMETVRSMGAKPVEAAV
jgi:hypothetical protein